MDERQLFLEQLRLGQHAGQPMQLAYAPLVASGFATARVARNRSSNDKSGNTLSSLFGLKRNKSKSTDLTKNDIPCALGTAHMAVHTNYAYGTVGTVGGGQVLQLLTTNPQLTATAAATATATACYPPGVWAAPAQLTQAPNYAVPVRGSASMRCLPSAIPIKQRATILPANWTSISAANAATYLANQTVNHGPAYALQHEYSYAEQISIGPLSVGQQPTTSLMPTAISVPEMHLKGNGRNTLARLKRKNAAVKADKCHRLVSALPFDTISTARSELDLRQTGSNKHFFESLRASRSSSNLQPSSSSSSSNHSNQFATVNERFLNLFRKSNSKSKSNDNLGKKNARKSILDNDLTAYDLVRQELEGQPAAVKRNPLRNHVDIVDTYDQRSLSPSPVPSTPAQRRLVQSYGESLDKLHAIPSKVKCNGSSAALRIAGQGVNLFNTNKNGPADKNKSSPKEVEVDEEEGHNTRMHVYKQNFERLPSLRKSHSVDSLPAMPEPDYDLEDNDQPEVTGKRMSTLCSANKVRLPVRPSTSKCSTSSSGTVRCSSLSSSSSFSSNSSAEECIKTSTSSSGCSVDSAHHVNKPVSNHRQDKPSNNSNSIVVKSILKKSSFGIDSCPDCVPNGADSTDYSCQYANNECMLMAAKQQPHNHTTPNVVLNDPWESDSVSICSNSAHQNNKHVNIYKCNRPKKQVHFRSSFDQTLIVEQIEHILEESEEDDAILSDFELEEEDHMHVLDPIGSMQRIDSCSVSDNCAANKKNMNEEEEAIYDDIGIRTMKSVCPAYDTDKPEAGPNNDCSTFDHKTNNQSSLAVVCNQTKPSTPGGEMQLNPQLSQELDQLVSEFREFNPACSNQTNKWQNNVCSDKTMATMHLPDKGNVSTKSDCSTQTKGSDQETGGPEAGAGHNYDRPEEGSRCVSSASSTSTYASCSSNYASDASSYMYSGLDGNASGNQRISRSAILQNYQQTNATGANDLMHGSQSTDSGNHSDESLGVDESTTSGPAGAATATVTNDNTKHTNRIVIDVPSAETYEPLQSEHIYEELRCTNNAYPIDNRSIDNRSIDSRTIDSRSIFEGASRQQILEYLAKRRVDQLIHNGNECDLESLPISVSTCNAMTETPKRSLPPTPPVRTDSIKSSTALINQTGHKSSPHGKDGGTCTAGSDCSDCSECIECTFTNGSVTIERQDSGVGPETSAPVCTHARELMRPLTVPLADVSNIRNVQPTVSDKCLDCEQPMGSSGCKGTSGRKSVCNKCEKRRTERKEIIAEFVDTEFKYGRDLRIIREEFLRPIRVAGLLNSVQLEGVFANLDELIQVNSRFSEKLQDTLDLATEQGDTIGRVFMESTEMLHSFENYCIRQASASLLLAQLVKEKELLRVFLRVSQMENPLLRRMNLSAFLMVPVQRVTRYPLLLNRLYKVTPPQHPDRHTLRDAQQKVELHLEHINQQTKEAATSNRIWRRISNLSAHNSTSSSRISQLDDIVDIKVKKAALESLQWSREHCEFVICGRLSFGSMSDLQLTRKSRSLKMPMVNALLIVQFDTCLDTKTAASSSASVNKAVFLLIKEKSNRYQLCRPPMFLNACVISSEPDCEEYFEIHEIESKESLIFKAEIESDSSEWVKQLKLYSSKVGNWRKRRNALPNIMMTMNKE